MLPYFEESKDKMDNYLSRFEKYATANKWDKNMWAAYLSALMKVIHAVAVESFFVVVGRPTVHHVVPDIK